jgi:hypothetical protein
MALEIKGYEHSLLERRVDTCVLGVFVRLRLDLIQTGYQLLVICLDTLESLRRKSVIRRPRVNKAIHAIDGVRGG